MNDHKEKNTNLDEAILQEEEKDQKPPSIIMTKGGEALDIEKLRQMHKQTKSVNLQKARLTKQMKEIERNNFLIQNEFEKAQKERIEAEHKLELLKTKFKPQMESRKDDPPKDQAPGEVKDGAPSKPKKKKKSDSTSDESEEEVEEKPTKTKKKNIELSRLEEMNQRMFETIDGMNNKLNKLYTIKKNKYMINGGGNKNPQPIIINQQSEKTNNEAKKSIKDKYRLLMNT